MPPFPTRRIAVRPLKCPHRLVVLVGLPSVRMPVSGIALDRTALASTCNQSACEGVHAAAADMVDVASLTRFLDATEQQIQVHRPRTPAGHSTHKLEHHCLHLHREVSRLAPNSVNVPVCVPAGSGGCAGGGAAGICAAAQHRAAWPGCALETRFPDHVARLPLRLLEARPLLWEGRCMHSQGRTSIRKRRCGSIERLLGLLGCRVYSASTLRRTRVWPRASKYFQLTGWVCTAQMAWRRKRWMRTRWRCSCLRRRTCGRRSCSPQWTCGPPASATMRAGRAANQRPQPGGCRTTTQVPPG